MNNYFMLDGKEIPMSDETADGVRDALKRKPFDEIVDAGNIRVSSQFKDNERTVNYPIRLSLFRENYGRKEGFGDGSEEDNCAGEILSVYGARKLIDCLGRAIKHHGG